MTESSWKPLSQESLNGQEYQNAIEGWRHEESGDEIVIYSVPGTGMEDITDKEYAVQHPESNSDGHTDFCSSLTEARKVADKYRDKYPDTG